MSNTVQKEIVSIGPMRLLIVRCLNPAECEETANVHVRVGNEIHHCRGGPDGCECGTCMNLFWGAKCGDRRVLEYLGGRKDANDYNADDLPNILDLL